VALHELPEEVEDPPLSRCQEGAHVCILLYIMAEGKRADAYVASEGGAPFVARRAMKPARLCPPFFLQRGYPRERNISGSGALYLAVPPFFLQRGTPGSAFSYGGGAPPLLRRLRRALRACPSVEVDVPDGAGRRFVLRFLDVTLEQLVQHRTSALFGPHDLVVPFVDARRFLFETCRASFRSTPARACAAFSLPSTAPLAGSTGAAPRKHGQVTFENAPFSDDPASPPPGSATGSFNDF